MSFANLRDTIVARSKHGKTRPLKVKLSLQQSGLVEASINDTRRADYPYNREGRKAYLLAVCTPAIELWAQHWTISRIKQHYIALGRPKDADKIFRETCRVYGWFPKHVGEGVKLGASLAHVDWNVIEIEYQQRIKNESSRNICLDLMQRFQTSESTLHRIRKKFKILGYKSPEKDRMDDGTRTREG